MKLEIIQSRDKTYIWQTYKNAMQTHIEKIWGWELAWQKQDFEKNLIKYTTGLIKQQGKTIGYIQYKVENKYAYINMLILEPTRQSQGLGGEVLNHLVSHYKLNKISLRCFKVNTRAFDFYLSEGFCVIEEDENFYLLTKSY